MLPLRTDNVSLLGNKALWYAAAAGAALGLSASDVDAQIVYVGVRLRHENDVSSGGRGPDGVPPLVAPPRTMVVSPWRGFA